MSTATTTISPDLYRDFGRTGLRVSPIGFGGAPIGLLEKEQDAVTQVLHKLLDSGVNVIDTSACYYGSEQAIGDAVSDRRDEFVLVSKCGHAQPGGADDPGDFSAGVVRRSVDESLRRLRTDRLDVVLLHSCDLATLKRGDALAAAVEAREAGKVRFVGYSGDNEAAAYAAGLDDVAVIQTSVSICDQRNIDVVLPETVAHNVGVMAKRPIANAAWKAEEEQYERYRNYARPYRERFETMGLSLDDLRGGDWPSLALRFALSVDGVHTAIVGTTKLEHVESNLRAAAAGPLPTETVDRIRRAFRDADPEGQWHGLT